MSDLTGREDFIETWLTEMPTGLGSFDTYDQLVYIIKDRINSGSEVIELGNGLKKIQGQQVVLYWFEANGSVVLGSEVEIKPQGLVVTLTGKNPRYRGKEPFASDLYNMILDDSGRSLRLFSDNSLSDEGFAIWKRMFQQGHKVSLYDRENPGQTFQTFNSIEDMEQYFADDDTDYKRYQYVLSEQGEMLAETRGRFHTRRFRELIPGLL